MMTTSSSSSQLFTDNKETLSKLITQSSSILQRLSAESSLEIPNHIYSSFTQSHNIQFNSSDQVVLSAYLENTIAYLSKLYTRINDTHSRVLVTGDLNAGKSTFVNAMLRREVVPDDQQPCTSIFAEVLDAATNSNKEQVHAIHSIKDYDINDPSSYSTFELDQLRHVVEENTEGFSLLKVYCRDADVSGRVSLLHNGVVDISFIDSPGLNIDSIKTMNLFAKQEEIDVIIFVVNAENHFTLSGKEFLTIAGKEKAYIFIVVNRFDQITRRIDRCKNEILDQIKEISPNTYADAENLVHFISAKRTLANSDEGGFLSGFEVMEDCLRSFILEKRSKSKLAPAKYYLKGLCENLHELLEWNLQLMNKEFEDVEKKIEDVTPDINQMIQIQEKVLTNQDELLSILLTKIDTYTTLRLTDYLTTRIEEIIEEKVEWHGIIYAMNYAKDLHATILSHTLHEIRSCQSQSKQSCLSTLSEIQKLVVQSNPTTQTPIIFDTRVLNALDIQPTLTIPNEFSLSGLLQEYIPGLSIFSIGILGTRGFLSSLFNSNTKIPFLGLSLIGFGYVLFTLSNTRNQITQTLVTNTLELLTDTNFVENETRKIVDLSGMGMRTVFNGWKVEWDDIVNGKKGDLHKFEGRCEGLRKGVWELREWVNEVKEVEESVMGIGL